MSRRKRIRLMTKTEVHQYAKRRTHTLEPQRPEKEPLLFLEAVNLFELEELMQQLPRRFGAKLRCRSSIKEIIRWIEMDLQIVLEHPYDKRGQKREKYITPGQEPAYPIK